MMSKSLLLLLSAIVCLAQAQRCPPQGSMKKASPRNDCGYIKCHNGCGQWYNCPDGHYFVEQKQCCVPRRSRVSSGKSNAKPSSGSGSNQKRPQKNGGSGGSSGGSADSDHHWRR